MSSEPFGQTDSKMRFVRVAQTHLTMSVGQRDLVPTEHQRDLASGQESMAVQRRRQVETVDQKLAHLLAERADQMRVCWPLID